MKKFLYLLLIAFSFLFLPPLAFFLILRMPSLKGKTVAKIIVGIPLAMYTLFWVTFMFTPDTDKTNVDKEQQIVQSDNIDAYEIEQNAIEIIENSKEDNDNANTGKTLEDIDISQADKQFDIIYKAVEDNEIAAKDMYVGNRYVICGTINGMQEDDRLFGEDVINITLEQYVDNTIVFYFAEFYDDKWREDIKQLSVGDTIYFEGTCEGGYWRDCDLIQ